MDKEAALKKVPAIRGMGEAEHETEFLIEIAPCRRLKRDRQDRMCTLLRGFCVDTTVLNFGVPPPTYATFERVIVIWLWWRQPTRSEAPTD